MKRKRLFGLWLAILSMLVGATAAGLKLSQRCLQGYDDFTAINLLGWFVYCSGVTFIALLLLLYPLRLFRWFSRWFFTWRTLKRCLLAFAGLLILIFLFYAEEDVRGKHIWERYKHHWEAQGEKLAFTSFVPAAVPDDQNFALTPVVASAYSRILDKNGHRIEPPNTNVVNRLKLEMYRANVLTSTNMLLNGWRIGKLPDLKAWQTYYRTMFITNRSPAGMPGMAPPFPGNTTWATVTNVINPMDTNEIISVEAYATNEFPFAAQPQSPAVDVLLALSKFDAVIDELRQASRLPESRFPLNYDDQKPWETWNPAAESLKSCAFVLQLRATAEMAAAQNEKAMADIKLLMRLAESIHSEPLLNSQELRIAIINLGIQPIWAGLVHHQWSEAQLVELVKVLSNVDFLSDYVFAARAECAHALKIVDRCRLDHNQGLLQDGINDEDISFQTRIEMFLMSAFPNGWYYLGQRVLCRAFMEGILPAVDLHLRIVSPGRYESLIKPIYSDIQTLLPWNFYAHFMLPAFQPFHYAKAQTGIDCARLAFALERYRNLHGNYPETLDVLAPQFITVIPHDLMNGQPLKYRRTDDGTFLLYSVGWDGKDDGGMPEKSTSWPFKREGDWVWQFPLN